ncbi:hypothetical protein GCM10009785_28810 [Brooklawnia cerclae]|uniref:Protein phosphatase n=1 Tax=Brooklawnia cerclae TaxID=349934 RepID=A0ABX0SHM2_9ACTN|nr:protein phosphatase 2C domain-containing protein [Brooklawnia cerclae]NIH56828.1 protein phosphatase [Brooklawnia cerclae]
MEPTCLWHLDVGARSDVGPRRRENQDSGFVSDRMLLIADGVGGAPAGDVASSTVVANLAAGLSRIESCGEQRLRDQVSAANSVLHTTMQADQDVQGMATTLTGLVLCGGQAFVVHLGDSRAYRLRDGRLEQVTTDDSWVQMLIDEGLLAPEDAPRHPMRHLLLHSLSGSLADPGYVHVWPVDVRLGDRWVLTTDGLTDYLPEVVLATIVASTPDPRVAADALVDECFAASLDNITVLVADIAEGEPSGRGQYLGAAAADPLAPPRAG